MQGRKITTVEIDHGYLVLESDDAVDFITDQIDSGMLWQTISRLLNDYIDGKADHLMDDKMNELIKIQKIMLDTISKSNIKAIEGKDIIEPKEVTVIKEVKMDSPIAPKGTNMFDSLASKFNKFKG